MPNGNNNGTIKTIAVKVPEKIHSDYQKITDHFELSMQQFSSDVIEVLTYDRKALEFMNKRMQALRDRKLKDLPPIPDPDQSELELTEIEN